MRNLSNTELLYSLTASRASRMIRRGELRPTELIAILLERIDETESTIKAYVTVCKEASIEQAKIAERRLKKGKKYGPLFGLPLSIKDLFETKGVKTTGGSKIFSSYLPETDATVVSRLKDAGAILIGKTNTHEFACGGVTPPTCNPWNPHHIPGGSSGGSAAAISAGSALISLGSDTGGSIRIPASYCGVVGLKPTYGRVSRAGVFPESWSLDHVGPITKTVRDCAIIMNFISGPDERDPTTSRQRVPDYTRYLQEDLDRTRIGIPTNYFFDSLEKGVRSAVNEAIRVLEGLGAEVEFVDFPMVEEIMGAYTAIDCAEAAAFHEQIYREKSGDYQVDVREYIEPGFFLSAVEYIKAQRIRGYLFPLIRSLFNKIDVLVTPSQPNVAPTHGTTRLIFDTGEMDLGQAMVRLCAPFNLTGLPSLSIPCGFSGGLPIGLQIVSNYYEEGKTLQVGNAFERATRWRKFHPSI